MKDLIEVAYVFEERPSVDALETLFEGLSAHPLSTSQADSLEIVRWDEPGQPERHVGTALDAARACNGGYAVKVAIEFGAFELGIGPNHERECLSTVPHVVFDEQVHPFTDPSTGDADRDVHRRRVQFASVLAHAAELLDPNWGFGRWGKLAVEAESTVNDLLASNAPPLYEYNVFDRQTVEAIGPETVLDTPAWYTEKLDTGGVFLVPCQPPNPCAATEDCCVTVARSLGLDIPDVY